MKELVYLKRIGQSVEAPVNGPVRDSITEGTTLEILTSFDAVLQRAGITLSGPGYLGFSITIGCFALIAGAKIGPLFGLSAGVIVAYELITSFVRIRIARREFEAAEHLPLCFEALGECVSNGMPLERALIYTCNRLPQGVLLTELDSLVLALQRGNSPMVAIRTLGDHLRGAEMRTFVTALKLHILDGSCSGDSLRQLGELIQEQRRAIRKGVLRGIRVRQLFFVCVVAILISGMWLASALSVQPHWEPSIRSLVREIGGILVVLSMVCALRITSRYRWEGGNGG